MDITEVRIFPRESEDRKLKAYATITIDSAFVVRNVKVIEGNKGLFVAMPSRKLREACPKCRFKNAIRSKFCNQCGSSISHNEQKIESYEHEHTPRQSGHRDIAHPITPECREYIQNKVLQAYNEEKKGGVSFNSSHAGRAKEKLESKVDVPEPPKEKVSGSANNNFE
ncbi:MAG: septation protein SpoVG family protein, partial [Candidatus Omnitrophota bacterium]|nr:septation protein SpoVG family protein [Candidatus Omnitrophota bacterium]